MNLREAVSILRIRLGDEAKVKFPSDDYLEQEIKTAMHNITGLYNRYDTRGRRIPNTEISTNKLLLHFSQ